MFGRKRGEEEEEGKQVYDCARGEILADEQNADYRFFLVGLAGFFRDGCRRPGSRCCE